MQKKKLTAVSLDDIEKSYQEHSCDGKQHSCHVRAGMRPEVVADRSPRYRGMPWAFLLRHGCEAMRLVSLTSQGDGHVHLFV